MDVTVEKLKAARRVMVRIVHAREDRAKFIPIILELEPRNAGKSTQPRAKISVAANEQGTMPNRTGTGPADRWASRIA